MYCYCKRFLVCAPANVKQEQVVRIVAKWLKDNPSKLHLAAEYAASVSLREAFPCAKNKSPRQGGRQGYLTLFHGAS